MTSWREKIWRSSIGHYGGMFVEVPAENIQTFKSAFPKKELPREIKMKSVRQQLTQSGAERFEKRFPKSGATYYSMYFSDRSKGLKRFEDLFPKESPVIDNW